jgi:tRNA (guanine-N7-)-methyltransferase
MGRRALKKIDPLLDLSRWYLEEEQLPNPLRALSLFGREASLEIEVGSGKGLFMSRVCVDQPDRMFLGIEVRRRYAQYAAARLARAHVDNGKMICGDALRIFRERIEDETVAAVHVYFPDPWWKSRHRKRRVMTDEFVKDVQRVLQPGGVLHFWTDVEEYYQETLELLANETTLVGPRVPEEQAAEHDLDYRTHFERRMRLHGEPVYRSEYTKRPTD